MSGRADADERGILTKHNPRSVDCSTPIATSLNVLGARLPEEPGDEMGDTRPSVANSADDEHTP